MVPTAGPSLHRAGTGHSIGGGGLIEPAPLSRQQYHFSPRLTRRPAGQELHQNIDIALGAEPVLAPGASKTLYRMPDVCYGLVRLLLRLTARSRSKSRSQKGCVASL